MGEYATYKGQRVKIGTCEDMYYLRADQAHLVKPERGNVDPTSPRDRAVLRFRFPWPDEDGTEPGDFDHYDRGAGIYGDGVTVPEPVEHHQVQFVAAIGYNVCLPCPEGPKAAHGLTVHRNDFAGPLRIVQQGYRAGVLAVICACGGCGAPFNLPTLADAEPVIVACRANADRDSRNGGNWWRRVAERIEAGYQP